MTLLASCLAVAQPREILSDDGRLRIYEHLDIRNTRMTCLTAVQYKDEAGELRILSFHDGGYNRGRTDAIYHYADSIYFIHSRLDINDELVYEEISPVIVHMDRLEERHGGAGVEMRRAGLAGDMLCEVRGLRLDPKSGTVTVPQLGMSYPMDWSGRYFRSRWNGFMFEDVPESFTEGLHPSVSDFAELLLHFRAEGLRIHVDRLEDGRIRYAAWQKDTPASAQPSLILFADAPSSAGGPYIFRNGNFSYEVSFRTGETAAGYARVTDVVLTVKRAGKVLSVRRADVIERGEEKGSGA